MASVRPMAEVAKIPDWHDMDWNQFLQHWDKRHRYEGTFDDTSSRFPDDDIPLWYAIRSLHDRIHKGVGRNPGEGSGFDIPTDHIHLPPVDPEIQRALADLL